MEGGEVCLATGGLERGEEKREGCAKQQRKSDVPSKASSLLTVIVFVCTMGLSFPHCGLPWKGSLPGSMLGVPQVSCWVWSSYALELLFSASNPLVSCDASFLSLSVVLLSFAVQLSYDGSQIQPAQALALRHPILDNAPVWWQILGIKKDSREHCSCARIVLQSFRKNRNPSAVKTSSFSFVSPSSREPLNRLNIPSAIVLYGTHFL